MATRGPRQGPKPALPGWKGRTSHLVTWEADVNASYEEMALSNIKDLNRVRVCMPGSR